jgi:uncharacterized protein YyaL (SSP411 family)
MPLMVSNLVLWHAPPSQVVLVGTPGSDDLQSLERVLARHYLPAAVTIVRPSGQADAAIAQLLPWLAAMDVVNGRAAAYVCQNFTCQAPVTDPAALDAALNGLSAPRRIIG